MLKGEVWLINLDPSVGAEIHKTRHRRAVGKAQSGALPVCHVD